MSMRDDYNVLSNVAEVLDLWLDAPVPIVLGKQFVLVEEAVPVNQQAKVTNSSIALTYPE